MQKINVLGALFVLGLMVQCKEDKKSVDKVESNAPITEVAESVVDTTPILIEKPENIKVPEGMVWIPGGEFIQGAVPQDKMAMDHEKPAHKVKVDGFFMDVTEVTNAQFAKFVKETGYVTVAERAIDWEEMKTQVPEGTPKPHDSILQPGSLTFKKTKTSVPNLYDFSQWWNWTIGANWKQPNGPGSTIKGKDNEPVVQVAYEDALAYCEWAGRRLPTEAEWERAARGNKSESIYFWGDDDSILSQMANTWEGEFPVTNNKADGYEQRAKVKSYPPNDFGLYDMAGNVWEWTSDWYNTNYYNELGALNGPVVNPQGASTPYNPNMPYAKEKVMRGGSFLCNASYCASYRISSRMASSLDSSLEHLGFRTVATVDMLTE
tara:strand:- start:11484 stop:12617 length:1134 start_codon:yes stop_codon:yes gene_type:complete